jgi:hypothetical protein
VTLHAFLILWSWLSHHSCVVFGSNPGHGTGQVVYVGSCTESISVARQVGGTVVIP